MIIVGGPSGAAGSIRYTCAFCSGETWLMPASQKVVAEEETSIICLACYLTNPRTPEADEHCVSSHQELVDIFGSERAEWIETEGLKRMVAARRAKKH